MARFVSAIVLLSMAALFVLIGLGFVVWSFYLYAARHLPQDGAALLTAAVTLLLAGFIAWAARLLNR